jgi:hypothetical protein
MTKDNGWNLAHSIKIIKEIDCMMSEDDEDEIFWLEHEDDDEC